MHMHTLIRVLNLSLNIFKHGIYLWNSDNCQKTKYCIVVKFLKFNFWWTYKFWGSLNWNVTFSAVGLSMDMGMCVCLSAHMCMSVISITQRTIIIETLNFLFFISIQCRWHLNLFTIIGQTICVKEHVKALKYITAYGWNF